MAATTLTRPQRLSALGESLRRQQTIGPLSIPVVAGIGAGLAASFAVDWLLYDSLGTPLRQFADALAFAVVAAPAWLIVQRREVRDAIDVITWLNAWESHRWQDEVGRRLPSLPRANPQLLDSLPDTLGLRPLRVELLAARGELDEAYERLDRLPADTPWQRFERAALAEWLSFVSNGPDRIAGMAAAVPALDAERSLVARAMIAAAQARRAAVSGGDVIGHLAPIRADLGERPDRYAFPYRTGVIISVVVISLIASIAVAIASAIIR